MLMLNALGLSHKCLEHASYAQQSIPSFAMACFKQKMAKKEKNE
jgi:hypothetical protein